MRIGEAVFTLEELKGKVISVWYYHYGADRLTGYPEELHKKYFILLIPYEDRIDGREFIKKVKIKYSYIEKISETHWVDY